MKKLLSIFLVVMFAVTCTACSSAKSGNNGNEEDGATKIEYYSNSNVPTLESVAGENLLEPRDGYYLYGTYDTEEEAKIVMDLYVSALVISHGFERNDTSVGYELTNGTDIVKIFGANKGDKLAICVMIN